MLIDDFYPSKYLKATDLKGHEATVEIENVAVETIGRDGERRPVASLVGKKKKLVLNKTNLRSIAAFLGPETASWPGNWIVIYPTTTDYAGKETACLRVKPPRDHAKPSVAPDHEPDDQF
jgi:hypothetical protein